MDTPPDINDIPLISIVDFYKSSIKIPQYCDSESPNDINDNKLIIKNDFSINEYDIDLNNNIHQLLLLCINFN